MKSLITLSFLALSNSALYAQTSNYDYEGAGIADCSGVGGSIHYTFSSPPGQVAADSVFILVAYINGITPDTVLSTTWTEGMNIDMFISLPAINVGETSQSAHQIVASYTGYFMGMPTNAQDVQTIFYVPMFCDLNQFCHGSLLTSTGGDALWLAGADTLGVGDMVYVTEPDTITIIPIGSLGGTYNNWFAHSVFINPVWTDVTTSADYICGEDGNGTAKAWAFGTAPYTYSWSNDMVVSDIIGLNAGSYTVVVTDAEGCSQAHTGVVLDSCDISTSISENILEEFQVYPSPVASGETFIVTTDVGNTIEVYDLTGKILSSQVAIDTQTRMSSDNLVSGYYFVNVRRGQQVATKRLVVGV